DHGHAAADEIGHQFGEAIVFIVRPAILDRHGLPFDVAGFAQALAKRCHKMRVRLGDAGIEKPDDRHWLLRARGERPSGGSAEERNEISAFHSITSSTMASTPGGM